MGKELTDAWLRKAKYKPIHSKGPKLDGVIHKRTGKPVESREGQLLPNRVPDRDGMYAHVAPTGAISFRYDFRWPRSANGRRQCITYGRYPVLSLQDARDRHTEARRKLAKGINPLDERRLERQADQHPTDFRSVATRWYEKTKPGKSNSWTTSNLRYLKAAYPYIGARKVSELTSRDLNAIIAPVENDGRAVTAEKMRQTYMMVFDYAAGKEFLIPSGANPARVLRVDRPETTHYAHMGIGEVPAFLKAVDADTGGETIKIAVKLLFLCLTRKMELVGAKWTEFDLDAARWEIPAERMKGKKAHIVPLSHQAVALFRRLKELANGSEWVFPHRDRPNIHMMNGTVNKVFRRTGYGQRATPHGCRSTASSALNEMGKYRADVIERQLSHIEADEVRASYNHADYMNERRAMLQDWADAIDRVCAGEPLVPTAANVIPLHAVA